MRLHVYNGQSGQIRTVPEAAADSSVADHLELPNGTFVFAVDDEGREIDPAEHVADTFSGASGRLVSHPGRQIRVVIDYAGRSVELVISPGLRLGAIRDQAIAGLGVDPSSAADLGLRLPRAEEDLSLDKPVASIAQGAPHINLELVALVRPQG